MEKVKSDVKSETSLTAVVDSTSDVAHLNVVKKEFSLSNPSSYGGLALEHAVGSIHSGISIKLKMEKEIKPEVLLSGIVDSTSDVASLNEIKKEFPCSGPHSHGTLVEHVVVKHEDTIIQSLDLQIESKVPHLKYDMESGSDDIYTKLDPIVNEELHIKNEIEESFVGQTIKMPTQVDYLYCVLCSRKFELKTNLQRHMKTHTGKKPHKCSVCVYSCIRKNDLQRHLKTHTGEKPHKCSICDYKCVQKSTLQQHTKTHAEEKPFQCNVCDYRSIQKRNLKLHITTHTGEIPHKCGVCDYSSIQKCDLERHMRTHTGEKPFQCNLCDYKSIQKRNLKVHMKTHTGEKPHKCSLCDYGSTLKRNLQLHIKTHTGEKPHKCNVCDYSSIQNSHLQRHMKTHTGGKK